MIIHNFAFKWQPGVTDADKHKVAEAIRGLNVSIPGILATFVGPNVSPRSLDYEFGGSMHFPDQATLDRYNDHPVHQELLSWLRPLIETAVEVDFETSASAKP